jgi:hypothetical protein
MGQFERKEKADGKEEIGQETHGVEEARSHQATLHRPFGDRENNELKVIVWFFTRVADPSRHANSPRRHALLQLHLGDSAVLRHYRLRMDNLLKDHIWC